MSSLRFDFDGDDMISPDEVYILLSYIPFKNYDSSSAVQNEASPKFTR